MTHPFAHLYQQLLPQRCGLCLASCQNTDRILCNACFNALPRSVSRCYRCALPLYNQGSLLCGECLTKPPAFTRTITAFDYDFPANKLILQFKYHRHLGYGSLMAKELCKQVTHDYQPQTLPDALIAVPNHWRRQLHRGYNQAAWIARELNKVLNIPLLTTIQRHEPSHPQEGLNRKERKKNLKNAFRCTNRHSIRGKYIAVIDDVMTTGVTASILAELLLQSGARRVDVWCIARTSKPGTRKT